MTDADDLVRAARTATRAIRRYEERPGRDTAAEVLRTLRGLRTAVEDAEQRWLPDAEQHLTTREAATAYGYASPGAWQSKIVRLRKQNREDQQ